MHAIAGRLSPVDRENSGIETIETNTFKLQVLQLRFHYVFCSSLPTSSRAVLSNSYRHKISSFCGSVLRWARRDLE